MEVSLNGHCKVAIHTLGCKANQYDGEKLAGQLWDAGFQIVPYEERADAYIVNSCTVTAGADAEARMLLRQAQSRNPKALVIATGCYATVAPEELKAVEGVTHVVPNDDKCTIVNLLKFQFPRQRRGKTLAANSKRTRNRSRAFVKIQDGCNFRCSFCVIPFARGPSQSVPIPQIIQEIQELAAQGYHEVVLTGIHIGSYGWDLKPRIILYDLMEALAKVRPIDRIRLSTLDPDEVSRQMIDLIAEEPLFCPHLHLAIQSGVDGILKKMRRRHTLAHLESIVTYATRKITDLLVGADLISGFPGEQEKDHEATMELIERHPIFHLHVFPFSVRRGTYATSLSDQVPIALRRIRARQLTGLGQKKRAQFYQGQMGKKRQVIFEEGLRATTDNYIRLTVANTGSRSGSLGWVRIDRTEGLKVWGELA